MEYSFNNKGIINKGNQRIPTFDEDFFVSFQTFFKEESFKIILHETIPQISGDKRIELFLTSNRPNIMKGEKLEGSHSLVVAKLGHKVDWFHVDIKVCRNNIFEFINLGA